LLQRSQGYKGIKSSSKLISIYSYRSALLIDEDAIIIILNPKFHNSTNENHSMEKYNALDETKVPAALQEERAAVVHGFFVIQRPVQTRRFRGIIGLNWVWNNSRYGLNCLRLTRLGYLENPGCKLLQIMNAG
jgi:hypothetical protein